MKSQTKWRAFAFCNPANNNDRSYNYDNDYNNSRKDNYDISNDNRSYNCVYDDNSFIDDNDDAPPSARWMHQLLWKIEWNKSKIHSWIRIITYLFKILVKAYYNLMI